MDGRQGKNKNVYSSWISLACRQTGLPCRGLLRLRFPCGQTLAKLNFLVKLNVPRHVSGQPVAQSYSSGATAPMSWVSRKTLGLLNGLRVAWITPGSPGLPLIRHGVCHGT
jgi:hypothetical protein